MEYGEKDVSWAKKKMIQMDFTPYFPTLCEFCAQYRVRELYAFGSMVRGDARQDSDLDLLVTFGEVPLYDYFDNYLDFKTSLETLFARKVDLVESQTVKNPFLKQSIQQHQLLLYGQPNRQIFNTLPVGTIFEPLIRIIN